MRRNETAQGSLPWASTHQHASRQKGTASSSQGPGPLDRLDLRGLCGQTARLEALADGFGYEDGDRYYRLIFDDRAPEGSILGVIEAWTAGHYYLDSGDLSLSVFRQEFARSLAHGDTELEGTIDRDLFRFSWAIRFAKIDLALTWGLDDTGLTGDLDDEEELDLLVQGLNQESRRAIARLARRHGGAVFSRRPV